MFIIKSKHGSLTILTWYNRSCLELSFHFNNNVACGKLQETPNSRTFEAKLKRLEALLLICFDWLIILVL
jgi:hypothetical protein